MVWQTSSPVERWFLYFDVNGLLHSSIKLFVLPIQNMYAVVLERMSLIFQVLLQTSKKVQEGYVTTRSHIGNKKQLIRVNCFTILRIKPLIVVYFPQCTSHVHSSGQWTAYTRLLLCQGVQSFRWTSICLSVLLDSKNTGMQCFLKIILSFSDTPDIYGITMLLCLFFFSSPPAVLSFFWILWLFSQRSSCDIHKF